MSEPAPEFDIKKVLEALGTIAGELLKLNEQVQRAAREIARAQEERR